MVDLDEYRTQSRAGWDSVAAGWKRRSDWLAANNAVVIEWLVAKGDPRPGQTWLDVAGGPGDLALALADRVGNDGRVIYSDFSPAMVEVARERAGGRANVELRELDAEAMDLADDSVDGVACRYGFMLMADPAAALAETRRVLRDGGALAFAVWSNPEGNPWAALPMRALMARGVVPPPDPTAPGMFAMGAPERIRELVTGAGFADPEIEEISFSYSYSDEDDLWDALLSLAGALARAVNAAPEEEQEASRAAVLVSVADFRAGDGSYTLPASTWGVLAR